MLRFLDWRRRLQKRKQDMKEARRRERQRSSRGEASDNDNDGDDEPLVLTPAEESEAQEIIQSVFDSVLLSPNRDDQMRQAEINENSLHMVQ